MGGLAFVTVALVLAAVVVFASHSPLRSLLLLSLVVAALGLIDDLHPLSARVRLLVQLLTGLAFVMLFELPPSLELSDERAVDIPTCVLAGAVVLFLTANLNIYNFMDGMDGLAATQAATTSLGFALLWDRAGQLEFSSVSAIVGASVTGFLVHNMPPARIFMGDAGSTFLGFVFAAFVVLGTKYGIRGTESMLLLAPFLCDGAFTILRRALRREPIWKAHRTHLYQRAVSAGLSHRDVLLVYSAWMATSVALALMAHAHPLLSWGAAACTFVVVILWVHRLELRAASTKS